MTETREVSLQVIDASEYKEYILYPHEALLTKDNIHTCTKIPALHARPGMREDTSIPTRSPERLKKNLPSPDIRADISSFSDGLEYHSDDSSQMSVFSDNETPSRDICEEDEEEMERLLRDFGYIYEQETDKNTPALHLLQVDERVVCVMPTVTPTKLQFRPTS